MVKSSISGAIFISISAELAYCKVLLPEFRLPGVIISQRLLVLVSARAGVLPFGQEHTRAGRGGEARGREVLRRRLALRILQDGFREVALREDPANQRQSRG